MVDDPRYFEHPDRYNADILWFTRGYVEYAIPNFIPASKKITQITISAELSSEAPGTNNDWPSDISFYLNDIHIGDWTSPRRFWRCEGSVDTGLVVCKLEPVRIAKTTCHQSKGTYIDGLKISDVKIDDFHLNCHSSIRFRLAVEDDARHVGGLTIFGKSFGNYSRISK